LKKILIATKSKGKLNDIREIFKNLNVEIISLLELDDLFEIDETGNSFEENAMIKAKKCFEQFNLNSIGDDSGLVVQQLNGQPGIYSARYAGKNATEELNNQKLIDNLKNFSEPHRAKFVCVVLFTMVTILLMLMVKSKDK
jgi:XTP/dITP diphosphohydrolase